MKLPDWVRLQEFFHLAMALPEGEREAFARRCCKDEPALLAELISLLAAAGASSRVLDHVIGDAAMEVDALGVRTRIGPYDILGELGRGGMGIVYLAERADGQYRKQVAIKVVRLGYASEGLEARFLAERQILANLEHANIARLLDGGTLPSGQPYLVMEYVAGKAIDEFCRAGNLSILDRLRLFLQICDATAYAHLRGVIHRDLKPGNILVNADGVAKLLDFGTAKLIQSDEANRTLTQERRLTPAYASPEQILGRPAGPASDVYSLGVVLYELIAGQHPFQSERGTPYAMERAICERQPQKPTRMILDRDLGLDRGSPAAEARALKEALDDIVFTAMRKDPVGRYGSVAELAREIRSCMAIEHPSGRYGGFRAFARRPQAFMLAAISAAVFTILVIAAIAWLILKPVSHAPGDEVFHVEPLTSLPGDEYRASLSPDGSRVVFCWTGYDGVETYLWVKQVDGNAVTRLTTKGRDEFPAWSPDGKWIAFVRSLKDVMLIPSLGGVERKIGETPTFYLSWTPDSSAVIVGALRPNTFDVFDLDAIAIESGKRTRLTSAQDEIYGYQPFIPSPDGRMLGFARRPAPGREAEIYVRPMAGGPAVQLTRMGRHLKEWTWTPDSREIVFAANPDGYYTLWRVRADGGRPPSQIKLGVTSAQSPFMVPAAAPRSSAAGSLLGFESWERTANFHELRLESAKTGQRLRVSGPPLSILASSGEDHSLDFSPDGQRAVFVSNRSGFPEVWLADGFAGDSLPLTSLGRDNRFPFSPRWSNDGTRIVLEVEQGEGVPAFAEPGRETSRILVLNINGGAPQELANTSFNVRPSWSRNDQWIYFGSRRSGAWQLWRCPISAARAVGDSPVRDAAVPITTGGGFEALESLDGKQLFYKRSPWDQDLWVMPIGPAGPVERAATKLRAGGVFAGWWAVGGDGVFFADIANDFKGAKPRPPGDPKPIYFLDLRTKAVLQIAAIDRHLLFYLADFTVSRDGRKLVYSQMDIRNIDLRMARNFR